MSETLIKLFTLGIFSVESGAKAYFELILVIAALCASGYILLWQIPLLLVTIIFGTLAAGMFSVLAPQYLSGPNSIEPDKLILKSLKKISEENLEKTSQLSGQALKDRLICFHRAQKILENHSNLASYIMELDQVLDNIKQSYDEATEKIEIEEESYRRKQSEELEKQREASEARRRKEEEDRDRKIQEAHQEEMRQAAEPKSQQEKQRKADLAEKEKEEEDYEQKRRWREWLEEQRRQKNFTGGCPPDNDYDPPRCRPNYPIKVTLNLNKREDGFDGIIWQPSDTEYETASRPKWCYSSVDEALHVEREI